MKQMPKINKVWIILAMILVVVAISLCLTLVLLPAQSSNEVVAGITAQKMTDAIAHDPTKLDLPDWVIMLITVSMYIAIGVLGTGILCYLLYIIVWFIRRRKSTMSAEVSEQEVEYDGNPNLIKMSLGEEGANEKSN